MFPCTCSKNPHTKCGGICDYVENLIKINDFNTWMPQFVEFIRSSEYAYAYGYDKYTCLDARNLTIAPRLIDIIIKISEKIQLGVISFVLKYMNDANIVTIILNQEVFFNSGLNSFIGENSVIELIDKSKFNAAIAIMTDHYDFTKTELIINKLISKYYNDVTRMLNRMNMIVNIIIEKIKTEEIKKITGHYQRVHKIILSIDKYINDTNFTKLINFVINTYSRNDVLRTLKEIFVVVIMDMNTREQNIDRITKLFKNEELSTFLNSEHESIINKLVEYNSTRGELYLTSKIKTDKRLYYLVFYGLKINKNIVLNLIGRHICIDNIENYGIDIDNDIMNKCSMVRFYPYKYVHKPPTSVLESECNRNGNIESIKYLKELGGEFNDQCLINSCKIKSNSRVIKYLIEKCNVQVNLECIKKFELANAFDGLSVMLKNYDDAKPKKIIENKVKELNTNCVMKIEKKKLGHEINDDDFVFDLKKKVISFFKFTEKKYNYRELKLCFLEYLLTNNLTVGKYFVIDKKLSTFFKIEQCVVVNAEDIDSVLTYFVKDFYPFKYIAPAVKKVATKIPKDDKIKVNNNTEVEIENIADSDAEVKIENNTDDIEVEIENNHKIDREIADTVDVFN